MGFDRVLLPRNLVPDYRVQDEEQLAHGCDERHLPGLAPTVQTGVDGGVVAGITAAMQGIVHTEARPPRTPDDMSRETSCCSPWFTAMGKEPARYLYCKDVECDPPGALP